MNAPFDHSKSTAFENAFQSASTWRSACIQQFAELELTVADVLQWLAVAKPGVKVKQTNLIRPDFDELKRLTGSKSPWGTKLRSIARSLDEIDRLIEWRAHLTHGVLSVWQGGKGQWLLTLRHRDPSGGPVRVHSIARAEADEMLECLTEEVAKLQQRINSTRPILAA